MSSRLKTGDLAPVIQTIDIWGNAVNMPSKDKWVYVSFHRFATCPFCNLRTNELIRNWDDFQENQIDIVSIWPSAKEELRLNSTDNQSPFPIVSDETKALYRAYGVTNSSISGAFRLLLHPGLMFQAMKAKQRKIKPDADPMQMPASFLIDPNGIVRFVYYGNHYGDHPEIAVILGGKKSTELRKSL